MDKESYIKFIIQLEIDFNENIYNIGGNSILDKYNIADLFKKSYDKSTSLLLDLIYYGKLSYENILIREADRLIKEGVTIDPQHELATIALLILCLFKGPLLKSLKYIQFLINNGVNVDCKYKNGWTPLMIASFGGHIKTIELLIKNGTNVNYRDEKGRTPLMLASRNGRYISAKILLENGADVNATEINGLTALDITFNEKVHDVLKKFGGKSGKDIINSD
ncbi:MAG: ankyrin repeat domain-containing protein [Bacteroidia bacterium]|nr:ankyrin repeat domain-containing protein [Bacteroidia bacterium]